MAASTLANINLNDVDGFVVKDYTGIAEGEEPTVCFISPEQVFAVLEDVVLNGKSVVISTVSKPVLDTRRPSI